MSELLLEMGFGEFDTLDDLDRYYRDQMWKDDGLEAEELSDDCRKLIAWIRKREEERQ